MNTELVEALRAIRDYDGDIDGVTWEQRYGDRFPIDETSRQAPQSQIASNVLDQHEE